jgi:hypothetical protein
MTVLGLVLALTLVLAAVGVFLIFTLSRAREVQLAAEAIATLAWPQIPADDTAWQAFVELASTGSTGAAGQGYRDPGARHPRFITIGTRTRPELWIGEARPIPVDRPMPPTGPLADRVRAVLESRPQIVSNLAPLVHVGPHAWVMVSPVARGGTHMGLLVETAKELSKAFDA